MNSIEVIEINQGQILEPNDLKNQVQNKIVEFNKQGYKVVSTEVIKNKLNPGFSHAERLFMMVILEKM